MHLYPSCVDYDVGGQHFSLYHCQTIDFTGIIADFKSVSNSEFFTLLPDLSLC